MRRTLHSVVDQSVQPDLWVVVDDGSTDATPQILAEYAARHEFIRIVRRDDRETRMVGPGVIEAFNAGLATIDLDSFDYFCKLDLDLALPNGYFEELIRRMEEDHRIGTCSGKPYFPGPNNPEGRIDGQLISEACGDETSVGMTKFYRTQCFREIGGFVSEVMWDGIDCHRCRMLGWIACSWDDPELRFVHLRPMGASDRGLLRGRMRWGYGQYYMGTSLEYMTASALYRMTRPPYIVGGLAMWLGYVRSIICRLRRFEDQEFRRFLRRYHRRCLLHGKAKATRLLNEETELVWRSHKRVTRARNMQGRAADTA